MSNPIILDNNRRQSEDSPIIVSRDRSLPTYVYDIETDHSPPYLYWFDVSYHPLREASGQPIDTIASQAPGRTSSATQGTPSAQPTWLTNDRRVEYAGDDFLADDDDPGAEDGWTAFFVWDRIAGTDSMSIAGWEDTSDNAPVVWLLTNSSGVIRTKVQGEFGNKANPSINSGLNLSGPTVTAHRIQWSAGQADVWANDGGREGISGTLHDTATASLNRESCPSGHLGAGGDQALPLQGHMYEGLTTQVALSDNKIEAIIDQLVSKWKI